MRILRVLYAFLTAIIFPSLAVLALFGSKARPRKLSVFPVTTIEEAAEFIQVLLWVEDRRFFFHQGIDFLAVIRAAVANVKSGRIVQGASTLSQQLAKNLYHEGLPNSLPEKLAVLHEAVLLERLHSKDELLELYLNCTCWGVWQGLRLAAAAYFKKRPENLGHHECVALVTALCGPLFTQKRRDVWAKKQEAACRGLGMPVEVVMPEVPVRLE